MIKESFLSLFCHSKNHLIRHHKAILTAGRQVRVNPIIPVKFLHHQLFKVMLKLEGSQRKNNISNKHLLRKSLKTLVKMTETVKISIK